MVDTGDRSWGHLADSEHVGRLSERFDYMVIPKDNINDSIYAQCLQAAHSMLYSKDDDKVFGIYSPRAAVLMQMRFDGYLGFPGGIVDEGERGVVAVNRELVEELGVDLERVKVKESDHVVSHYSSSKQMCLHFYACEIPMGELRRIERNATSAQEYGLESLGIIRVPLFTMGDGFRGFPNFLTNSFAGNARQQLLAGLLQCDLMTQEEINLAKNAKPQLIKAS